MENLSIAKDKAIKTFEKADDAGKAILKELLGAEAFLPKVTDRIKNFDDILADHGKTPEQFQTECAGLEDDEVAYRQAKMITKTYNLHQVPDYSNTSQPKYFPYWNMPDPSGRGFSFYDYVYWYSLSGVGARLDFLSKENMLDAVKKFLPIYERLYTIKQ